MAKRTKMPIRRRHGQRVRVALAGGVVGWVTTYLEKGGRSVTLEFSFPPYVRIDREEVHLAKVRDGHRPADATESDDDNGQHASNEPDPDAISRRHGE